MHVTGVAGVPLVSGVTLNKKRRDELNRAKSPVDFAREYYTETVRGEIQEMMLEQMAAATMHAAMFSSSRLHLLATRNIEKRLPNLEDIEVWEDLRSAQLPWIRNLNPQEIVNLREEAAVALPLFREVVASALIEPNIDSDERAQEIVHMLRAEAAEVSGELDSLKKPQTHVIRNIVGASLGMTISVYGLATGAATESAALLLGLLALLHGDSKEDHKKQQALTSRPGYVLVKAKEFLTHANEK